MINCHGVTVTDKQLYLLSASFYGNDFVRIGCMVVWLVDWLEVWLGSSLDDWFIDLLRPWWLSILQYQHHQLWIITSQRWSGAGRDSLCISPVPTVCGSRQEIGDHKFISAKHCEQIELCCQQQQQQPQLSLIDEKEHLCNIYKSCPTQFNDARKRAAQRRVKQM